MNSRRQFDEQLQIHVRIQTQQSQTMCHW